MADDWEIDVPVKTGEGSSSSGTSGGEKKDSGFGAMAAAVAAGTGGMSILATLLEDVVGLLSPLIKVLQTLFVVIFMPLMPLINELVKAWSKVIDGIVKLFSGEISLMDFLTEYFIPAFVEFYKAVIPMMWDMIKGIVVAFFELGQAIGDWFFEKVLVPVGEAISDAFNWVVEQIVGAATWLWEGIKSGFNWIMNIHSTIWGWIVQGFLEIVNFGSKIWDFFVDGLEVVGEFGTKIWNILVAPFEWLGDKIKTLWKKINVFSRDGERAMGGAVNMGGSYLVGEKGPELFTPSSNGTVMTSAKTMGGGAISISINNTSVRNDGDIKKIANEVSKVLQSQLRRRVSA